MTETLRTLFALDKNIEVFVQHLPQMVIIFALISFGGWVYETIYCSVVEGEFTKRGFLFGPTCPIYGIGALAVWLVLGQISNPFVVFFIGGFLATVIEYSTGLFLERRFKKKWWDYSMFKFNLHGRICPQASAVFGAFSVTSVFVLVPTMLNILMIFSKHTVSVVAFIVVTLYFLDTVASLLWNGPTTHHKVEAAAQDASIKVEEAAQNASQKVSAAAQNASQKANAAAQKANAAAQNATLIATQKAQQVSQKVQVTKQKLDDTTQKVRDRLPGSFPWDN
ncbi:PF06541 family protein [Atopobium sp. BS2]|uniref:putative ABC transporter permease n=1 Tax=Atopobium sp. BS2 TaxID=936550 RepID=UPI00044C6A23|nr:putative ABC transporter permease [Atopobium sp. BS2]EWC93933.1 PF06541 family protein [Atopobium sp. BS2]